MMLDERLRKRNQVYKILKMPIVCQMDVCRPYVHEGKIYTGQKYRTVSGQVLDEDMSDIAIGYYEILYGNLLMGTKVLDTSSSLLFDCCFAGDTMNSFNSIANVTKGAGKTTKQRTISEEWPEDLQKYYDSYHCLANFWLIPMCIGRTSKKLNYYDSMDIFLGNIKDNYEDVMKKHQHYYDRVGNYEEFEKIHHIQAYNPIEKYKYCEDNSNKLIEQAMNRIEQRAKDISESDISQLLWEYFNNLKLF